MTCRFLSIQQHISCVVAGSITPGLRFKQDNLSVYNESKEHFCNQTSRTKIWLFKKANVKFGIRFWAIFIFIFQWRKHHLSVIQFRPDFLYPMHIAHSILLQAVIQSFFKTIQLVNVFHVSVIYKFPIATWKMKRRDWKELWKICNTKLAKVELCRSILLSNRCICDGFCSCLNQPIIEAEAVALGILKSVEKWSHLEAGVFLICFPYIIRIISASKTSC